MAHPKADPAGLARANVVARDATKILVLEVPDLASADRFDPERSAGFQWWVTHWPTWVALRDSGRAVLPFGLNISAGPGTSAGIGTSVGIETSPGPETSVGLDRADDGPAFGGALVFMMKSRERLQMTLALAAAKLPEGAPLQVVGTKDQGIGSAERTLEAVATKGLTTSGRHAKLITGWVRGGDQHGTVTPETFHTEWTAPVAQTERLPLVSYPGVFSHGRLDDGTRLLLETVRMLPGPILDVGCGAGVVGLAYRIAGGAPVTLLDADAGAVAAARGSLARCVEAGLIESDAHDVEVVAGDGFPAAATRFQSIVSNPPFHQGVATNHRVTARLIQEAPNWLLPGGTLTLVCNRFLPILDPLDAAFGGHRILADDGRYRVVQAGGGHARRSR
jgi:16S rRNA (guanine1207-N2)-methyltransferase